MANLSIAEGADVVAATTSINQLLQLDAIWTEAVAAGSPASGDEIGPWVEQLASIVKDISNLVYGLEFHHARLSDIVNSHRDEADATLRTLLWENVLDGNVREDLRWWIGDRSIRELWSVADSSFSHDSLVSEVDQLQAQLSEVERGQAVAGDLGKKFCCDAANNLFTGGILLIPAGIGVGVAAVGAGIATGGVGLLIAGAAIWWARKHRC
jgi:hypothetical protein